jgi:toxin FitB
MVNILLDTNVVSEAMRRDPDAGVMSWLENHEADCFLSAITLGEIAKGLELLDSTAKKRRLSKAFADLQQSLEGRILDFDRSVALRWATLTGTWQRKGRRLSVMDSMIEATALHWNMPLATRNTRDFAEVRTINPWLK